MTVLVARTRRLLNGSTASSPSIRIGRWWLPAVLLLMALLPGVWGETTRASLADAYLQVSVFVSLTLLVFYGLERGLRFDLSAFLDRHFRWQVPVAAVLGMTPGCGGAIMVMTAYARGRISFGSVVATLTATMGDAAFVLIAQRPVVAAVTIAASFVTGLLSGYLVDRVHGPDFMRPARRENGARSCQAAPARGNDSLDLFWFVLSIPGAVLGVLLIAQVDPDAWLGWAGFTAAVGITGSLLASVLFAMQSDIDGVETPMICTSRADRPVLARVAGDTAFVSVWVIAAYLGYEYFMHLSGWDIGAWFVGWASVMPLLGVLIGLIPGCGPQVVVTTLYVNGLVPYSALLGNAISNDGDALFPALAIAPKAAVYATVYSAMPALILGYGTFLAGY